MSGYSLFAWEILEIIWINILLSGDNAILIALACRHLPPQTRRWGVILGALGGVVLRIIFTLIIVELMAAPLLKVIGGLLLLGVAIKLLIDETDHSGVEAKADLWGAVTAIVVADAVMSLDNVIAIAAAAQGRMELIVFGLSVSVPIVVFGAGALLKVLERFPALVWAGAGVLGWVAGEMAASDAIWSHMGLEEAKFETLSAAAGCVFVLAVSAAVEWFRARRAE
jgi:YjbE family integral membrane protein